MQKHNSAREPGLHFVASPFKTVRPSISKIKSSFQLYQLYIEELKKASGLLTRALSTIGKHQPSHAVLKPNAPSALGAPGQTAAVILQSDCSRLAYNSAPSDRSAVSIYRDCNLGHLECSRSAVSVFWECNLRAILLFGSAIWAQHWVFKVQSERNLVAWKCIQSAVLVPESIQFYRL